MPQEESFNANEVLDRINDGEWLNSGGMQFLSGLLQEEYAQEQRNADTEPGGEPVADNAGVPQSVNQYFRYGGIVGTVGQTQGLEKEGEQHGEVAGSSLTGTSAEQQKQIQFSGITPECLGTSVNRSESRGGRTAGPVSSNNRAPSGYQHRAPTLQNEVQWSINRQLDTVRHGFEYAEDLKWIASKLPGVDAEAAEECTQPLPLCYEEFQHSGRIAGQSAQGVVPQSVDFESMLFVLRQSGASCEEIQKAIDIPKLPYLDDEMEHGFQREVMDPRFNAGTTELLPWTVENNNSPALAHINAFVGYIEGRSLILAEDLFNQLFQLSRRSFLQRDEGVHLELWSYFLSTWRNASNFEMDAKEVIMWMEKTFVPGNLAAMTQNLINCIDQDKVIRQVAEKTKLLYHPDQVDMTILGSFYSLMSKHSDIMKSNSNFLKVKKDLDTRVKNARSILESQGQIVPKATYGKNPVADPKKLIAREIGMSETFAGTRWLIVGNADAHFAYGCSVLETVKQMQKHVEKEHIKTLEQIKDELEGLESRYTRALQSEENEVIPGAVVARKVLLDNRQEKEILRPVYNVEHIVLTCLVDTMKRLARIKVMDLFRCMGVPIPKSFARALVSKQDEIEKLRGIGNTEGMVVSDVLKVREMVEKEVAKNESAEKLLERKKEYLQGCESLINANTPTTRGCVTETGTQQNFQQPQASQRETGAGFRGRYTDRARRDNGSGGRNLHRETPRGGNSFCRRGQLPQTPSGEKRENNNPFFNESGVLVRESNDQYLQRPSGRLSDGRNNPFSNVSGGFFLGPSIQHPQTKRGGFVPGPSAQQPQAQSERYRAGFNNSFSGSSGRFIPGPSSQYPQTQSVGTVPGPSAQHPQTQSGVHGAGFNNSFSGSFDGLIHGPSTQYPQTQNRGSVPGPSARYPQAQSRGYDTGLNNSFSGSSWEFIPGSSTQYPQTQTRGSVPGPRAQYPQMQSGEYGAGLDNLFSGAQGGLFAGSNNPYLQTLSQGYSTEPTNHHTQVLGGRVSVGQRGQQLQLTGAGFGGVLNNEFVQRNVGGHGMSQSRKTRGGPVHHNNRRYTRRGRTNAVQPDDAHFVRRHGRAGSPY